MTDGDLAYRVPDSEWLPDGWVMLASRIARLALTWSAMVLLFVTCFTIGNGFLGFLLALALVSVSIVLHEAGHAAAAVMGGATLVRVQVGALQLHAVRGGWRVRFKRGAREFAGLVQSFPSPYKPLRQQMMATVAAGPLVNAVLAVAALLAGHVLREQPAGVVLLGFGALNAALALANLLPWSSESMLASDGLQLWRWKRGIGQDDPQVAFTMLNARSIAGERFGEWAEDYLRVLERSTQPGPIFVLWARMKVLQLDGKWARVDEVMRQIELQIIGLSPPMAKAMEGFIAVVRCEAAFSRAMAGEALEQSPVEILGPDMGWLLPALRLRCQALECVRFGHAEMARMRLAESEDWSKRSIDRSLEHGEVVLRAAIAAKLERLTSAPA